MDYNFNIYEKIVELEDRLSKAEEIVEIVKKFEPWLLGKYGKSMSDLEDDPEGCWTVADIADRYHISTTTFYNYKKLIPISPSGRIGKFNHYRKKEVKKFLDKITMLKHSNPELFKFTIKKKTKTPVL